MEFDTALLIVMTACAICWYISFGIREQKEEFRALEQERVERQKRAERLKKLCDRSR